MWRGGLSTRVSGYPADPCSISGDPWPRNETARRSSPGRRGSGILTRSLGEVCSSLLVTGARGRTLTARMRYGPDARLSGPDSCRQFFMSSSLIADITRINYPLLASGNVHAACTDRLHHRRGLRNRLHHAVGFASGRSTRGARCRSCSTSKSWTTSPSSLTNPASLPWHINLREGTSQVTDSLSGGAALDTGPPVTWFPQLLGSRTAVAQWGMSPVIDATELRLLRIAYRRALAPPTCRRPSFSTSWPTS